MNYEEIVNKKKNGIELSYEELNHLFNGYLNKEISDSLMTECLKAIIKNDMTNEEIFNLTDIFIKSGDVLDLSGIPNTVDKHSTGGVGDKTSLIIGPIVACANVNVPKMSGRGLGYTGGTIDKLESIPGFITDIDSEKFLSLIKENGFALCSQSKSLVPMDAVVYALRDVTNTTNSVPLIAVSIMSKKIACGAENILVDIKLGNGALIKTKKEAKRLAKLMIKIGNKYNRHVKTMITDMNNPLGYAIGNSIEILEVIDILKNKKESHLSTLCLELSATMISMAKSISYRRAYKEAYSIWQSGRAYEKFLTFVKAQNGNIDGVKVSSHKQYILSIKKGKVKNINALAFGKLSVSLGAGRLNKEDKIDHKVGILLNKTAGSRVKVGELLCTLFTKGENITQDITNYFDIK